MCACPHPFSFRWGSPHNLCRLDTADDGGDATIRLTRSGVSPCLPPAGLSEDSGGITRLQTRQGRPGQGWRMFASMMYVSALLLFLSLLHQPSGPSQGFFLLRVVFSPATVVFREAI